MTGPGTFIALEGLDGSGTTTQQEALATALRSKGHAVHTTREPSDRSIGRLARAALGSRSDVDPATLALLFAADRLDHVRAEIRPALARGDVVVCDRYLVSSWVYQGLECDPAWVETINARAPWPTITFLLEVSVDVAVQRMADRGQSIERFETAALQRRVAQAYEQVANRALHGFYRIDGTETPAEVTAQMLTICAEYGL